MNGTSDPVSPGEALTYPLKLNLCPGTYRWISTAGAFSMEKGMTFIIKDSLSQFLSFFLSPYGMIIDDALTSHVEGFFDHRTTVALPVYCGSALRGACFSNNRLLLFLGSTHNFHRLYIAMEQI